MCQTCVDDGALSQKTYDEITGFIEKYPDAEFGPAHIVLGDCNVGDGHLKWCLGLAKASLSRNPNDCYMPEDVNFLDGIRWYEDQDPESLKATVEFLEKLLLTPEDVR